MTYTEDDNYEFDFTPKRSEDLTDNNNNMFTITKENVKSALVSAFVTAMLGVAGYIIGVNDIFNLDFHTIANLAVIAFLTGIVSLLKNFFTTDDGKFIGIVKTH